MIHRFTRWPFVCTVDGQTLKVLQWEYDPAPRCPACGSEMNYEVVTRKAPAIHGDEIDVTLEHGVCNPDGSPRRYTSRTELREAARAQGLVHASEFGELGSKWNPKPDATLLKLRAEGREAKARPPRSEAG